MTMKIPIPNKPPPSASCQRRYSSSLLPYIGCLLLLLFTQLPSVRCSDAGSNTVMGKKMAKTLRFLSPLQSLTLFSKEDIQQAQTPREEFLPRFGAGLAAEARLRDSIATQNTGVRADEQEHVGEGWDTKSAEQERNRVQKEEERLEGAFDRAASVVGSGKAGGNKVKRSKYQFVGIVQPPSGNSSEKVKWYAKKRQPGSKWNVRLVHVNREAVIKDLHGRGKLDIYGEYVNTGETVEEPQKKGSEATTSMKPLIEGKYSVKPRSWRTLWNHNPKHIFTDSSGAFWRERRLTPGLYTDGRVVYEARYRYSDGKNGMKPVALLSTLLKSKTIKKEVKNDLVRRLKEDSPDVVVEE